MHIALTINFIDIEYQVSCDYDYLAILDSDTSSSRLLLKACGKHTNITFNGKQFVIEFRSDKLRSRKGFQISWKMSKEQRSNAIEKIIQNYGKFINFWNLTGYVYSFLRKWLG